VPLVGLPVHHITCAAQGWWPVLEIYHVWHVGRQRQHYLKFEYGEAGK